MQNLGIALQITLIGMSLVFGAILLLWGLMALLVRLTADPDPTIDEAASESSDEARRQAAAAAVAVALSVQQNTHGPAHFPTPPTALVSAWQAVTRANQLNQKGPRK